MTGETVPESGGAGSVPIQTESELEELLTRPSRALIEFIRTVSSPLILLGAGGKMGPTLALLARRAAEAADHALEVIAVSRFSDEAARQALELGKVKTISCDLLDPSAVDPLPESANVIYLVGRKFGTAQEPEVTWAINTLVPARLAQRYARAHLVALSTGNVYPLSEVSRAGAREVGSPGTELEFAL